MISEKIAAYFAGKSVLVTGGSGMIGSFVVARLAEFDARVVSVSLDDLPPPAGVEAKKVDLREFSACLDLMRDIDVVFHVAGVKASIDITLSRPATFLTAILMMNTNVIEAARRSGVSRLAYTSSIGAYAPAEVFTEDSDTEFTAAPMDTYPGWAKRMAELQIQACRAEFGTDGFAVVRPCNVYGPRDNFDPDNAMVIPSLMARIATGESPFPVWGDGSAIRDFAYASDVADGIILAAYYGTGDSFVNLGSGTGVSVRQLVEILTEITGVPHQFDTDKPNGFPRRVMNIDKAISTLGYQPQVDLKSGLTETWEWYERHRGDSSNRHNYFAESNHVG